MGPIRIVYADNGTEARKDDDELVAKWNVLAPAVVRSLEEAKPVSRVVYLTTSEEPPLGT